MHISLMLAMVQIGYPLSITVILEGVVVAVAVEMPIGHQPGWYWQPTCLSRVPQVAVYPLRTHHVLHKHLRDPVVACATANRVWMNCFCKDPKAYWKQDTLHQDEGSDDD